MFWQNKQIQAQIHDLGKRLEANARSVRSSFTAILDLDNKLSMTDDQRQAAIDQYLNKAISEVTNTADEISYLIDTKDQDNSDTTPNTDNNLVSTHQPDK